MAWLLWFALASFAVMTSCGGSSGSSSVAPTSIVPSLPAVDGPWAGTYDAGCTNQGGCSGRSRLGDNLVSFAGAGLPLTLTLTQTGGQLSGTAELTGIITVPISGTVDAAGVMELSGSTVVDSVSIALTNWRTTVTGTSMTGSWLTRVQRPPSEPTLVDSRIRTLRRGGQPLPPPPAPTLTTIEEVSVGRTGIEGYVGQSVTVAGGPFNNIRFNWHRFNVPPRTPIVFGTLYLLTQEYLGSPRELSPATPGFLARSARIENEQYIFDANVTLMPGAKYWFYTDLPGVEFTITFSSTSDAYRGGDYYNAGNGQTYGRAFISRPGETLDASFTLQGLLVGTP